MLQKKFGDKYGKNLMDTAKKTHKKNRIRCCKTASIRVVQKTAEATRDLIGNNIVDKIISLVNQKIKKKKMKQMKYKRFIFHQKKDKKLLTI